MLSIHLVLISLKAAAEKHMLESDCRWTYKIKENEYTKRLYIISKRKKKKSLNELKRLNERQS